MKKLLLVHSSIKLSKIHSLIEDFEIKEWIPFISSYEKVVEIEKTLHRVSKRKEISNKLQQTASLLRRPFFEVTAKMGQQYNSLSWWANTISERNTMENKLFLHSCYVFMANSYIMESSNLCIVCDSNIVIDNISMIAEKNGYSVKKRKKIFVFKETLLRTICLGLYHLCKGLYFWSLAKINKIFYQAKGYERQEKPDIIIHTWVDEKCFGDDGRFKDRYFTILPEFYKSRGLKVSTFVTLHDIKRSYWDAISFFRISKDNFIIPEDYYRLYDYLFPFWIWFDSMKFKFNSVILEGVDFTSLFEENNRVERINSTAMYYLLFKRLSLKEICPKMVIDGFENMISDKMIQRGVRRFMSKTLVYGFYHTTPPPNVLCFFTDWYELGYAPLPDRIICNGNRYRDILIQEHFPKEKIVVGAALRYLYLYKIKKNFSFNAGEDFKILLTLPLERGASLETFYKLINAINGNKHYKLLIKPHPMGTSVLDVIKKDFPPNTEIIEGSMEEAISKCDIVVSAATSAAIDCVMANKEVVRVGRDTQIDFDPLVWFKEFGQSVYSIQDLKERIAELEKMMKNESYKTPAYSDMLHELFLPSTEESMSSFLPPD